MAQENISENTDKDKVICGCTGTTEAKIQKLRDDGVDSLERIADITGASTGCGSCDILIQEMLDD